VQAIVRRVMLIREKIMCVVKKHPPPISKKSRPDDHSDKSRNVMRACVAPPGLDPFRGLTQPFRAGLRYSAPPALEYRRPLAIFRSRVTNRQPERFSQQPAATSRQLSTHTQPQNSTPHIFRWQATERCHGLLRFLPARARPAGRKARRRSLRARPRGSESRRPANCRSG